MQPSYSARGRGHHRPNLFHDQDQFATANEAKNQYFESMLNRKLYQNAKEVFENTPAQLLENFSE